MEYLLVSPDTESHTSLCSAKKYCLVFSYTRRRTSGSSEYSKVSYRTHRYICNIDENQTARQRLLCEHVQTLIVKSAHNGAEIPCICNQTYICYGWRAENVCILCRFEKGKKKGRRRPFYVISNPCVPYEQTFGWTQNFCMNGMHHDR